ncbi:hypothetical protein BDM02DRAFT_3261600 [Thelephora ganbajun]|uniref:Uncharacterized protein n=1 Tax=Thelephora ganbajun TaxID=370292 RepID=A0ACB6ZE03_THEGA|nr:hypothetical protein BDM02DRAFT_3261600 [Thelephora ganbajun]
MPCPPPPQASLASLPAFRSTPRPMAAMTLRCGWVDLPKSQKRCWFARLPAPEHFRNYVAIMDDFGVDLELSGHRFQHLMMWELGHKTTMGSTSSISVDTTYHITVLVSPDMTVGRFRAFAVHIYISGRIPRAKYTSFSSTYSVIRRGSREKRVVDVSKTLSLGGSCRVPPRAVW